MNDILCFGNTFIFPNLEIAPKKFADIKITPELSKPKFFLDLWESEVPVNLMILYQMWHRIYSTRDNSRLERIGDKFLEAQREDWEKNKFFAGTRIDVQRDEMVINHLQPDRSVLKYALDIASLPKDHYIGQYFYLNLARRQREELLGRSESLPQETGPLLEKLLGPHANEAGAVLQYVAPRVEYHEETKMRNIRIKMEISRHISKAVALSLEDFDMSINSTYGIFEEGHVYTLR